MMGRDYELLDLAEVQRDLWEAMECIQEAGRLVSRSTYLVEQHAPGTLDHFQPDDLIPKSLALGAAYVAISRRINTLKEERK